MTLIILTQPANYLQCGQAAYPAFGKHGRQLDLLRCYFPYADAYPDEDRNLTLSTSVSNSC